MNTGGTAYAGVYSVGDIIPTYRDEVGMTGQVLLECDGSEFDSQRYPELYLKLNGMTLPDYSAHDLPFKIVATSMDTSDKTDTEQVYASTTSAREVESIAVSHNPKSGKILCGTTTKGNAIDTLMNTEPSVVTTVIDTFIIPLAAVGVTGYVEYVEPEPEEGEE